MITAHRERRKKKREDIKLFYKATIRSTSESGGQDEQERVNENVNLVVLYWEMQQQNNQKKRQVGETTPFRGEDSARLSR